MKIAVVSDFDVSLGFRLAGIKEVYNRPEAMKALINRDDIVAVFFQSKMLKAFDKSTIKKIHSSIQPAFVQIEGTSEGLGNLISDVLGVVIK
ncbi:MAG: hypothetical protein GOV01_03705 [Candidatus Altiarchaeota archaeon]|nr:hypothetical protein [Candidatus Altiarchaeota archaeon]